MASDGALPLHLAGWRFCPGCAAPLAPRQRGGRWRPTCPACGWVAWGNPAVGVAGVMRDGAGAVLLARRRTPFRDGLWCIPCGFVEGDETVQQAVAREMAEECGLQVAVGPLLAAHSNTDRDPPWTIGLWFAATPTGGVLRPGDDVSNLAFFDPAGPLPPLAFPTDALVLAALQR